MNADVTEPDPVRLRQCVILVGGMGSRLGPLCAAVPKPLLPVGGRPFLGWLLRELCRTGFEEAVLLAGHLSDVVRESLAELEAGLPRPLRLVLSVEPVQAGTGGALWHARGLLDARFLLCNGDSFIDWPLAPLLAAAAADGAEVAGRLLLRKVADVSRYGVVTMQGDVVRGFAARATDAAGPGAIYAGIGVFRRDLLQALAPECSLEQDVLPRLAEAGGLRGLVAEGAFIDIGVPEDYARAQVMLPRLLRRRAVFLDRGGVINVDHGYVAKRERFDFTPTALAAIAAAGRAGWHVFIVTNQSGVARGYFDEAAVRSLLDWVQEQALRHGGTIDDVRYCPTHPDGVVPAYARVSDWRKPAPGMLLDLLRAWDLDPARCLMVGDQASDLQAASAAGMAGYLFPGGDLAAFLRPLLEDIPA